MRAVGRLHVLTPALEHPGGERPRDSEEHARACLEIARSALRGGADVLQLREKSRSTREQIAIARALVALARRSHAALIVNDRVDVAIAADAHGVHLGGNDFPVGLARRLLGPDRVIGASAQTVEMAREAAWAGADYLGVGDVFGTHSKPDAGPVVGIEGLRRIVQAVEIPVIAIGDVTADRVADVIAAGAHGVAVIRAVCAAPDPEAAVKELRERLQAALESTGRKGPHGDHRHSE